MKKSTSELISALRLLLIMGLVWVHFGPFPSSNLDPFTGVYHADYFLPSSLNSFFVYFFLSAVPVLSIISGYLIALKGKPDYFASLKKRINSVILPSIIWTTFWLGFAFLLYNIGKDSGHFTYYDFGFSNFSIWTILNGIFGIRLEPFALQFWFVHDLILSILLTPLIYLFIKRAPLLYFLVVGGLWFIGWQPPFFFYLKVTIFFSFGIFLAQKKWQPKNSFTYGSFWVGSFIILIALRIYLPNLYGGKMPFESMFEAILRANGVVAVLFIAMSLRKHLPVIFDWCASNSGYAFFIFAAQFPTVILIKEVLGKLIGVDSMFKQIVLWLSSPILTILILVIVAKLISHYANSLFGLLNGQRKIKQSS